MDEEKVITEEQKDKLEQAINAQFERIRRQSMLLGFQVAIKQIQDMIIAFDNKPGSKSNNDHKRLIKEIKRFCDTGLSRKVNTDGETETVQD
jgi:hypothetical protein